MMKRLFTTTLLSIVMLLICAPGAAASDRAIAYHDLPLRAQSFVKKYFNPHKVVLVKEDRGFRDTDYDVKFTDGSEIEFNGRGEWTEVKCPKGLKNGIIPICSERFINLNPDVPNYSSVRRVAVSFDKLDCTKHDREVRKQAYRDFIKEFEDRVNSKDVSEKLFETECILLERDKNGIG
jgi:hypothetical protein